MAEIGEEKLRTWRSAFSPLAARVGHGPIFTLGDVIAICAVQQMVASFGVRISTLAPFAPELFDACEAVAAESPDCTGFLLIGPDSVEIGTLRHQHWRLDDVTIVIPLQPIFQNIRAKLLTEESLQELLPLEG